ncbi:MAG: hypothetical protein ACRDD1_17280 [Planctomycetia bacterium]
MPELSIPQEVKSLVDAEVARGGYSEAGELLRDLLVRRRRDAVREEIAVLLGELLDRTKPELSESFRQALADHFPGLVFDDGPSRFRLADVPEDRLEPLWERVDTLAAVQRSVEDSEQGRVHGIDEAFAELDRRSVERAARRSS